MFRGRVRHVHFVGIGGIGMSGLAEILRTLEFDVSGSDMKPNDITRRLETMGVRVDVGHRAENVDGADVVVFSSAIKRDNPEIVRARAARDPGHPARRDARRADAREVRRRSSPARTARRRRRRWSRRCCAHAGLDPTVVVGGKVNALGSNARLGEGDLLVAEADESDGSFLKLTPTIAVITNIDAEHLDHYGTHENVKEAFVEFANRVPFYGLAVLCLDHPHVQAILPRIARRHVTYGVSRQADYRAKNPRSRGLETHFVALPARRGARRVHRAHAGRHNVLNALAVIAVADELEVPLDVVREAIASFHGVQRRFTVVGQPTSRRTARRATSWSSTTTATTRPRSRRRSTRRSAASIAASSSRSSRIATRARAICSTSSRARSTRPTS